MPPATAIALLRGRLQDEPRSQHRRRVWSGLFLSVASWFLVATTIAIRDYFGAAQAAWDEVSLYDRIWIVAIDVLAAIGIVGLPRSIRNRFTRDEPLDDMS